VSDGAKTGTDREKLGWPNGEFTVWDDGDPHGSVYVVCPGGKMISFGDCGGVEMDAYRANFVADALNAAFRCKPQSRSVPTSKERREMPLNDAVRNKDLHLETALTEALKVAGELAKAGEFLRQDLDIELSDRGKDSEKRCAVIEFRKALAALERIRNNNQTSP
jgi:hypothetical protein